MSEIKFDLISELATSESFRDYVRDLYKVYFENSPKKEKTMSKYINAERFKLWLQENYVLYDGDRYFNDIDAQPAADVRENVHAHWVKHEDKECWYCSHCKEDNAYAYFYSEYNLDKLELQDLFCPKCGAQMDERSEDGTKQD